jgi:hypothetical protein
LNTTEKFCEEFFFRLREVSSPIGTSSKPMQLVFDTPMCSDSGIEEYRFLFYTGYIISDSRFFGFVVRLIIPFRDYFNQRLLTLFSSSVNGTIYIRRIPTHIAIL